MTWRVEFLPTAQRQFDELDNPVRKRIARSLQRLRTDPLSSPNVKALIGGGYRMRVGDWRVVYSLDHGEVVVLVLRVGHRREIYR